MKYQINDEVFTSKKKATNRRTLLNQSAKRQEVNVVNRVLKYGNRWIVRPSSKRRIF